MTALLDNAPASPVRCVIALGSNLGDRGQTLQAAVQELTSTPGIAHVVVSAWYESIAVTVEGPDPSAPPYLNGVLSADVALSPRELLAVLHSIEARHGRERLERWAARTLDLDIVTFGDYRSSDSELTLPHPRAHERSFVLVPWLDIEPDAVLPGHGQISALAAAQDELPRMI